MKNKIILIHCKARSGKDTVAEMIRNNCKVRGLSSAINSNAHSVKEVAREVFSWDGVKDERGRRLLIDITNAGYNYHPNFWEIENTCNYIKPHTNNITLIPDFRYETTYDYFKNYCRVADLELITIHVLRPDHDNELGELQNDVSETHLATFDYDITIVNNGTLEELESKVDMYFEGIILDEKEEEVSK